MNNKRPDGKFQKGQSGNPAGRKPLTEEEKQERKEERDIRKMALKHVDQALQTLVVQLGSDSSSAAVSAAKELLDRAFGKSTQHTTSDVTVTTNGREQLQRKLAGLDREPEAPGDSQSTH
jgi:hypothetical protein